MKKVIHRLRRQSEETRKHILHFSMLVLAVVMVVFWIYGLRNTLTDPGIREDIKQDLQPFSVLKDNVISGHKSNSNADLSGE